MYIALAQQNYLVGDIEGNTLKIISELNKAKKHRADLLVFSELSLTGYPPTDLLLQEDCHTRIDKALKQICKYAQNIIVLLGTPYKDKKGDLCNAVVAIRNQKIVQVVSKTLLPNYDVFNERRYFTPAKSWKAMSVGGKTFAICICEDIWFDAKKHNVSPIAQMQQKLGKKRFDAIINISASPFDKDHFEERLAVVRRNALQYKCPVCYVNAVGAQTDLIFDGRSMVVSKQGEVVYEALAFEEDTLLIDLDTLPQRRKRESKPVTPTYTPLTLIHRALILGIQDYFQKTGFQKALVGASGGIDSALVQVLATQALGRENVQALLMPSRFSSEHSLSDAQALSIRLGNPYHILPIEPEYECFLKSLEPLFAGTPFGLAEENLQSRIRGNLLMSVANKHHYLLLNTSNKSELAMGYGTLYGDMAGALSVLGDLFKTQVYELAHYIQQAYGDLIPSSILHKAPSAELRPHQKDSDSLPDYAVLDKILYLLIHKSASITDLQKMRILDAPTLQKTYRTYCLSEYKRSQFCPILRVSSKSFGRGRKYEVVGKY